MKIRLSQGFCAMCGFAMYMVHENGQPPYTVCPNDGWCRESGKKYHWPTIELTPIEM